MGAGTAKATTPVEMVEKNNPLVKGIDKISKKFNKRWAEIDQPWPPEGTFDPEVIKTLQVLVNTYKAEQKKGRKGQRRKEKREMELAILELFNQEGQKLLKVAKARVDKNIERTLEAAKLTEKHSVPFSHMSPLVATPQPYEKKSENTSLYPQLPLLTTEGRYCVEDEDNRILETGRAKTTIVMTPETKSKHRRGFSPAREGPSSVETRLKRSTGKGKKKKKTSKSIKRDSGEDKRCVGGYASSIKKILARAERRGKRASNPKRASDSSTSDSDDDSETSASSENSESSKEDEEALEERRMTDEQVDGLISTMEEDLRKIELAQERLREEMESATSLVAREPLEKSMEELQLAEAQCQEEREKAIKKRTKTERRYLRRYNLRLRPKKSHKLCPVLVRGRKLEYKPWPTTDMTEIIDKLPPLQDGAHPWISKLEEAMMGIQPAMGDIKRLLANLLGVPVMEEILEGARLHRYVATSVNDPELFSANKGHLWRALKMMYPTNVHPDNILIDPLGEKENPRAYVAKAHQQWRNVTGKDPDLNELEKSIMREKILQGLPLPVRSKIAEVVGLNNMTRSVFIDHIAHQVELHRKKEHAQKEQDQETLRKLNQIQLTGHKNKEKKQAPVMQYQPQPNQPQPPLTPATQVTTQPQYPQPVYGQPQGWRGENRGDTGPGGRGNGNTGPFMLRCFNCGRVGHQARNCGRPGGGNPRGGYAFRQRGARAQQWQQQRPPMGPVNPYRGPAPGF